MIELKVETDEIEAYLDGVLKGMPESFRPSFERIAVQILATVQRKLSGSVLQMRSGKLIRSAHNRVDVDTDSISAVVQAGALAPYAKVHEYGGSFLIPEHQSRSRWGNPVTVKDHIAHYPERSFMRTALHENQDFILAEIEKAVQKALGEG